MAGGCRDCNRCTEQGIIGLVLSPFRVTWWLLTIWNIGLFEKKCPQCSHPMRWHARRADGSLKD